MANRFNWKGRKDKPQSVEFPNVNYRAELWYDRYYSVWMTKIEKGDPYPSIMSSKDRDELETKIWNDFQNHLNPAQNGKPS
jgi:hypothetical protein